MMNSYEITKPESTIITVPPPWALYSLRAWDMPLTLTSQSCRSFERNACHHCTKVWNYTLFAV